MTRVLSDANRITGFVLDAAPFVVIHLFTIIATLIIMIRLEWKLALAALILLPITLLVSFKLRPRLGRMYGRRHRCERTWNFACRQNDIQGNG